MGNVISEARIRESAQQRSRIRSMICCSCKRAGILYADMMDERHLNSNIASIVSQYRSCEAIGIEDDWFLVNSEP